MARKKPEVKKSVGRPPKTTKTATAKPKRKLITTTDLIRQMQSATVSKLS